MSHRSFRLLLTHRCFINRFTAIDKAIQIRWASCVMVRPMKCNEMRHWVEDKLTVWVWTSIPQESAHQIPCFVVLFWYMHLFPHFSFSICLFLFLYGKWFCEYRNYPLRRCFVSHASTRWRLSPATFSQLAFGSSAAANSYNAPKLTASFLADQVR